MQLVLRTQQVAYLRSVSEREDITVSRAFRTLIEACALGDGRSRPASKMLRTHISIRSDHLAILDRMAIETGLSRSEVARRLIDEAAKSA